MAGDEGGRQQEQQQQQQEQEEEETEYESDPEEAKMSLKMRRREASDDEDEHENDEDGYANEDDDEEKKKKVLRDGGEREKAIVDSDGESDGQGGAAEYDDEEDEEEEYYDEEYEEEEEELVDEERESGGGDVEVVVRAKAVEGEEDEEKRESQGEGEGEGGGEGAEEKKENEPFAVPTSGAFYMHDDRFRDNAAGRHRRTFGGRKLWESKDERKWGHDKFEEMNMQERHYEEGRKSSRGFYRGRGKGRGTDRGYARGGKMRGYGGNNNQNALPKDVRGRGPRRYQLAMKNKSETLPSQNKQSAKSIEKSSHAGSGRGSASMTNSNVEHELGPAKKVASSLNSASPPFYPSGSSSKDISLTQKKEAQSGHNNNRNFRPAVVDQNFSMPLSNSMMRGKNVVDSIGMDKIHIDDSVPPASGRSVNNVHQPSGSSSLGATQMPQARARGRGVAVTGSPMFQPPQANNQVNKVPPPAAQFPQRNPVQNRVQPPVQAPAQLAGQRSLGSSQGSPPKAGLPINAFQPGDVESRTESGKSNTAVAGKGKGTVQGAGQGSLMYTGGQVMGSGGNVGAGHGDPNLPAFFPVMQFGAQHPGGVGVPAVGMAFPGYVAQPNGLGNSEMTWLPVLASAAGALGATYCPPYLAVDGAYPPRPTGQPSALPAPSKDNNQSNPNIETKPQERSEVSHGEFSQRQNKPRRYSEMNFSQ